MITALGLTVALICPNPGAQRLAAADSFDYPAGSLNGLEGGTGWEVAWICENNGLSPAARVLYPGLDAVGGRVATQYSLGGSFRALDAEPHGLVTEGGLFGKDGASIWLSFDCVRNQGANDDFGVLGLLRPGVSGERLVIGCPSGGVEWGIQAPGGFPVFVPGSDVAQAARLVCRMDFQAGDERARLWVDPADAHPAVPADAETTVSDFRFDEISLRSGGGTVAGFSFDGLRVEYEADPPVLQLAGTCPGIFTLGGSGYSTDAMIYLAYAIATGSYAVGSGPCQGTLLNLDAPSLIGVLRADENGAFSFQGNFPSTLCGTSWLQAMDGDTCAVSNTVFF